jgi:hypothetical protein
MDSSDKTFDVAPKEPDEAVSIGKMGCPNR